jgi:hypothetical protein
MEEHLFIARCGQVWIFTLDSLCIFSKNHSFVVRGFKFLGHLHTVKAIMELGGDIHASTIDSDKAAHLACWFGKPLCHSVELVLIAELLIFLSLCRDGWYRFCLLLGYTYVVKYLIGESRLVGVDYPGKNKWSLLHYASYNGKI